MPSLPSPSPIRIPASAKAIHPDARFCGIEGRRVTDLPPNLGEYLISLFGGTPRQAPDVSDQEWLRFLNVLKPHWVIPLLFHRLGAWDEACRPPPSSWGRMRRVYLMSRARALQMTTQLQEIRDAFGAASIPFLVIKGPALAGTVYPDPAVRPASDIDLLVTPDRMRRGRMALESIGYRCLDRRFDTARSFFADEVFVSSDGRSDRRTVELHWDLHRFSGIHRKPGIEELMGRSVEAGFYSVRFQTLSSVDALMHRAMNNAFDHDRDLRLIGLYDVLLLAGRLDAHDWAELKERSVEWRARLALELSLRLAMSLFGFVPPDGDESFSDWPPPSADERRGWRWVTRRFRSPIAYIRLHCPADGGGLAVLRSLLHFAFPGPAYMRQQFMLTSPRQLPAAYLKRWLKWFL